MKISVSANAQNLTTFILVELHIHLTFMVMQINTYVKFVWSPCSLIIIGT